jgi:tetratricopeptide (TPR) repeat protein
MLRSRFLGPMVLSFVLLTPAFAASPADDSAASLAAAAEEILDHWDGDAKALERAKAAIDESVRLDPTSPHARGVKARQVLADGTTEEGIRPSALGTAHGILFRAALEMQPADARVFAFLARLQMELKQDKVWWALKSAEKAGENDPWVKLAWAEYYARQGDTDKEIRYLEEAIAAGLASPPELRKAYDVLLPNYVRPRKREKADAAYAARVALDPKDPLVRGAQARNLIVYFVDFEGGERLAREALAISDYPQAHETLSLALYGQWARAARDRRGAKVIDALYRKADAHDPGGRMLPACLAEWEPLAFVYAKLEEKHVRRADMHRC